MNGSGTRLVWRVHANITENTNNAHGSCLFVAFIVSEYVRTSGRIVHREKAACNGS